ncbi:MAG: hypothetical protein Q8873_04925 [Bacillota bacterium]|nr:hypothetical protein [Bacillota bacterium]
MKKSKVMPLMFSALMIAAMLIFPREASEGGRNALIMCARSIVPTLFPFMVFGNLLTICGGAEIFGRVSGKLMKGLFGLSGKCALPLFVGFVTGYPVGAASTAELVKRGEISIDEGERLLAFCNNAGPMFVTGAVAGMLGCDRRGGMILWLAQILSAIVVGIIISPGARKQNAGFTRGKTSDMPAAECMVVAIKTAVQSILNVCGFIIIFAVIISVIEETGALRAVQGIMHTNENVASCVLSGILETASGCARAAKIPLPMWLSMPLISLILGWSGVSVHLQVASVISGSGMKLTRYFIGKILQTIIAPVVTFILMKIIPTFAAVSVTVTQTDIFIKIFVWMICACAIVCANLLLVFSVILRSRRRGGR